MIGSAAACAWGRAGASWVGEAGRSQYPGIGEPDDPDPAKLIARHPRARGRGTTRLAPGSPAAWRVRADALDREGGRDTDGSGGLRAHPGPISVPVHAAVSALELPVGLPVHPDVKGAGALGAH